MAAEKTADAPKPALKEFTAEEVAQHKSEKDVWLIIHGRVYDVTRFLEDHPGGPEILHNVAGQECTTNFEEVFHSAKARNMMAKYLVGKLAGSTLPDDAHLNPNGAGTGAKATGGQPGIPPAVAAVLVIVLIAVIYKLLN